ncbi:hypothetical protein [Dyadobacter sp. CY326]|uniref:hypothetical protein n=1 Tax=Dyadobacter sp. CY326 TaxID=2907300 RepID=UPI001F1B629F|nr:hypothetical protein [Dyadobacter sp. CY326]MCE7065724.1 hypothetical protein [Dyadobacter sp. CY326]
MKRKTRFLLGVSIALITAASLHLTVGHRFHHRAFGHYGHGHCGSHWERPEKLNFNN